MRNSSYRWENDDKPSQRKALAATVAVQVAMLLILFLSGFVTPLPLPGEKGIAISFGQENGGLDNSPIAAPQRPIAPQQPQTPTPQREETQLTQDFEEAPVVEKKPQQPTKTEKPTQTRIEQTPTPAPPEKKPERQVDKSALFPGASPNEQGKGIGSGGTAGNQGTPNAPLYMGNPGGKGGDGTSGTGQGNGAGGNGISYSLNGRTALQLPPPEYPKQRGGRVVVKVWVNRDGKVVRAESGEPGSTTFDQSLLEAAKKAALQAQFDVASNAPEIQTGTVTYVFQLKQ